MSNKKIIVQNSILLYFRMIFTMILNLYASRIILDTLGIDKYGIYNVVGGIIIVFTFISSALSSATQRYITFSLGKNNLKQLEEVFNTFYFIHIIICIIILLLGESIGLWFVNTQLNIPTESLFSAHIVYQISIFSTLIMIMSIPHNSLIIAYEKMNAFAYFSIVECVLKLSICYSLYLIDFEKRLIYYAVTLFIIQIFIRSCYYLYCIKIIKVGIIRIYSKINKELFKEVFNYSSWTLLGFIANIFNNQGINILLNVFSGVALNAARGISNQVQNSVMQVSSNVQMAINPQLTKTYAKSNLDETHSLIMLSTKISFFLIILVGLPLYLNTPLILDIWLKHTPIFTIEFIRISLIIVLVQAISNPLITSIVATGKIKIYQIVTSIISLIGLPISYVILIKGFPPPSILIIVLITEIANFLLRLYFSNKLCALPYKSYLILILKYFIILIISYITLLNIQNVFIVQNIIDLIIIIIISFSVISFFTFHFGTQNNEKRKFITYIRCQFRRVYCNDK